MSEYAIRVKNVSKKFKIHHEKRDSVFESVSGVFQKKTHSEILQALDDISFDVKTVSYTHLTLPTNREV